MTSARDDLVELFDYVWRRLWDRMAGLTDDEWRWAPTPDDRISLRWRLDHITEFLSAERNGPWLGLPVVPPDPAAPEDAAQVIDRLDRAYRTWRGLLGATTEESLGGSVGAVGGRYGGDTRRAFAFHVLDELIHHGAEAALLRDLYAARN